MPLTFTCSHVNSAPQALSTKRYGNMIFHKTPLADAHVIELEKRGDSRGFFARFFCENEFGAAGLETRFKQINNSVSAAKGTLRGMHYQLAPSAEVKVVRCVRGALWDCIIDLREGSPTYGKWHGVELTAENRLAFYVPRGFAHGFITLTDDTEALYLVSDLYAPDKERGVRWNDPVFGIDWPITPTEISDKDAQWRDFDPAWHGTALLAGQK
jgi:dTDP-4-dehydrorhamnose 3,5-epimerase